MEGGEPSSAKEKIKNKEKMYQVGVESNWF